MCVAVSCCQSSGLPGLPVLAFLIGNVFVAAFVPKMAASGSPEVTLVSVHRATSASPEHRQPGVINTHLEGTFTIPASWGDEEEVALTQQLALPAA